MIISYLDLRKSVIDADLFFFQKLSICKDDDFLKLLGGSIRYRNDRRVRLNHKGYRKIDDEISKYLKLEWSCCLKQRNIRNDKRADREENNAYNSKS